MCAIRDRSVVRSSVIPSARYCCSGSLLRLANGSTTIDNRGAAGCSTTDGTGSVLSFSEPTAVVGMGEDLVAGHSHQAMTPMTSAPAATAAIARRVVLRRRAAL